MTTPTKLTAASIGIALLAFLWVSIASAYSGYEDGCAACHADLTNRGPDHDTHADLANGDCGFCHDGGSGRDNPPLANCMGCHGREADGNPSADFSAGLGRGLRQHHVTRGVAPCGNCHTDSDHDVTGSAADAEKAPLKGGEVSLYGFEGSLRKIPVPDALQAIKDAKFGNPPFLRVLDAGPDCGIHSSVGGVLKRGNDQVQVFKLQFESEDLAIASINLKKTRLKAQSPREPPRK